MPRAQQLTQREIDARAKFGLGPKPAERAGDPGKIEQPEACPWNFDTAIEILRRQPDNLIMGVEMRACARARQNRRAPNEIAKMRARVRAWMHASVHGEIELICQMYGLECAIERQETEAAKAEAFQRAPRWHKHCQRALRQLREAEKLGDMVLARDAFAELRRYQLLPPALEQEAARLQQAEGLTVAESYAALRVHYARKTRPGPAGCSAALIYAVQKLQALAAGYARTLTWERGADPPDLTQFICEVLDTAGIKYPSPEGSSTRFRRLLIRPRR